MVISCSAYNCTNRQSKERDISFHRFPLNNKDLLKRWVIAVRRKDFMPNKHSFICSAHFWPEDYEHRPYGGKCSLKNNAVPSVFDFPRHLKTHQKKRKPPLHRGVELNRNVQPPPGPSCIADHNYAATKKKALKKRIKSLQQKVCFLESMEKPGLVKCEPVWTPDTEEESSNFENVELASGMTPLKQETEPEPTPGNAFEPTSDVKNEIFIEEHAVDPFIKEEINLEKVAVLTGRPVYSCDSCCKSFKTSSVLKRHLLTHSGERPYQCKKCSATFVKRAYLNRLLLTHTGQKPYSCKVCSGTFSAKFNLKTHMLTHTGDRPYRCAICSSTFVERNHLKTHMWTHSDVRPYSCTKCSSMFITKSNLQAHPLNHSGEKPYVCTICGSRFTLKGTLKTHLLTHTGEKPHCCNICSATFALKSNLKTHMSTHSRYRPFQCSICGSTFTRSSTLKRHRNIHT